MLATIVISGVSEAETAAKEILEHVEAIKRIQSEAGFRGLKIQVEINAEAASGN